MYKHIHIWKEGMVNPIAKKWYPYPIKYFFFVLESKNRPKDVGGKEK